MTIFIACTVYIHNWVMNLGECSSFLPLCVLTLGGNRVMHNRPAAKVLGKAVIAGGLPSKAECADVLLSHDNKYPAAVAELLLKIYSCKLYLFCVILTI